MAIQLGLPPTAFDEMSSADFANFEAYYGGLLKGRAIRAKQ